MAARRKRKKYTDSQRTSILADAKKDGLTAAQVQSKFGVTPVTYYSWRKKSGAVAKRGRGPAKLSASGGSDLTSHLRTEVRSKIQQMLPGIVKSEVATFMESLFGVGGRPRKL